MLSYWEKAYFLDYDFIIAGAGITGLSTALEIKEKFPHSSVLVIERGIMPTGASTKNAGFACMGSVSELLADLKNFSEDKVIELFKWRKEGLEILRKRLGDDQINYQQNGSYELISEKEMYCLDKIEYLNLLLKSVNNTTFKLSSKKAIDFGFSSSFKALIENICEGELNSGKMMKSLINLCLQKGIEIKTGVEIISFTQLNNKVDVNVKSHSNELSFNTFNFILCTNAFTKSLFPQADVIPGRGQVIITKPLEHLKFKGIYHFDEGYYYFRVINDRILFGGGRNIDFETEATTEFAITEKIQKNLEHIMQNKILPSRTFEIEERWSGIMAFGEDKFPVIRPISSNVYGAFRFGGMGVALASKAAKEVVKIITEEK